MFKKQDFKKVDLLGSGKKNTKIYKALHLSTNQHYALKEVEAKTLEKLNEYKVKNVILTNVIGRSCVALKGIAASNGHPVLRLFLLRDHV